MFCSRCGCRRLVGVCRRVRRKRRPGRLRRPVVRVVDGLSSMTASLMLIDAGCIIRLCLFAAAAAGVLFSMSASAGCCSLRRWPADSTHSHQVATVFTTCKLCQLPEIDPDVTRRSPVAGISAADRPPPCHASPSPPPLPPRAPSDAGPG